MLRIERFRQLICRTQLNKMRRRLFAVLILTILIDLKQLLHPARIGPLMRHEQRRLGGIILLRLGRLPGRLDRQPLCMEHRGQRLIDDLITRQSNAPGKVQIIAIEEEGLTVKSIQFIKQRLGENGAGCCRPVCLQGFDIIFL